MSSNLNLSQAVVLYLGFGKSNVPLRDETSVVQKWGIPAGTDLVERVRVVADHANQLKIDWSMTDLPGAERVVHEAMSRRYPELSNEALDAIAWKFTFDWR